MEFKLKTAAKIAILISGYFVTLGPALADGITALTGHVPLRQMARAQELGRKSAQSRIALAIVLNPLQPEALANKLQSLYTPGDPLYHQFLTPAQFAAAFGPSDDDINQVSQYLSTRGITVTGTHSNHLVIDVEAAVSDIENAFQIELHEYVADDGRIVYGPTSEPLIAGEIASKFNAIAGLSSFSVKKPHFHRTSNSLHPQGGYIPNNYMTPARLKSVYGLSSLSQTGSGETLALFELDGYTPSDISEYELSYSLASPNLTNILVDGASGVPSTGDDSGAPEVTLDIELAVAMAPGLSSILVYEAPNSDAGVIDTYSRIATDGLANEVSTSWASPENETDVSDMTSENTIFQEMAAQGQSIFAAAGDSGAYGDSIDNLNATLEIQDPPSQPYVTAVGGTTVTWNGTTYVSETSWQTTLHSGVYGQSSYSPDEGGGGGVSIQWPAPAYQAGLGTNGNRGFAATQMRMNPDVALDSDPNTGYPIYYAGELQGFGGTSCAAPLWAAFTALVNQQRVASGQSRLGFANPSLYQIGRSGSYTSNFHDIADASTNLYYPATTGYDLTTGWGSINGTTLFNSLVAVVLSPPAPVLTLTPAALSITASWPAIASATSYNVLRSTSSNSNFTTVSTGSASTSYIDTSVVYGTTYYYYIQAVNGTGNSPNSIIKSSSPYPLAPAAPSALTASVL